MVFHTSQNAFGETNVANGIIESYVDGMPSGNPIGIMSFWYNNEKETGSFYITVLENGESCVSSYGTKMKWNEDFLLEIINTQISK